MANPRYPQPQEPKQSSQDKKLGQLSSLLQISNASRQPQMEEQALQQRDHQAKMQMLLQMLGLVQSGQQHASGLDIRQQELGQQDRIARMHAELQRMGLTQSMEENQANLEAKQMENSSRAAATAAEGQLQYDASRQHANSTKASVLGGLAERQVPGASEALGQVYPELGAAQATAHKSDLQKKVTGLLPALGAWQEKPNGPQDPALQAALADQELGPLLRQHLLPVARSSTPDATTPEAYGPPDPRNLGQLMPQAPKDTRSFGMGNSQYGPTESIKSILRYLFTDQNSGQPTLIK